MKNPIDLWRNDFSTFRDFNHLQNLMEKMWGADLPSLKSTAKNTEVNFSPSCEVTEDKLAYHFKFDLPGLSKDQVKIELHDNQLTVTGERKEEKKEENKKYHYSEVSYGSFMRVFNLPSNIDPEKVEARFENGVLNISVAKGESAKQRQITIK